MALLDVLCGRQPLLKSTQQKQFLAHIEEEFPKFLNSRSEHNFHYIPEGSPLAMQLAEQKAVTPARPVDPSKVPSDGVLVVFSGSGPAVFGQTAIIYTVPLTQHFLLVYAFMAAELGAPPPIGSGMDFVPLNYPVTGKQTPNGVATGPHVEGIYIIQPNADNQAWSGNQVSLHRNPPIMIPAGAQIRLVRTADSVPNTMFGKVAGYLINTDGSDTNPPNLPPPPPPPGKKPIGPQLWTS